ncbi:hypothetical protein HAX54_053472 [Datura stramonium]|uniref:Uncharacterized protein n=1 Tax=Datura stramonium TaxID=4076 RepID=A0ABS8WPM5_DATST|nr:hypothetical protein [Datura stramonium]
MITPIQPIQNRRKSCFWKLQEIEEECLSKERGKSSSLSPKSRKAAARTMASRQAVTTIASKKNMKKDDAFLSSVQPKKLFKMAKSLLPAMIARCIANETPRDSGPAKRVVELIGRKSFFSNDEDKEPSVCQVLSFAEEDAEEE